MKPLIIAHRCGPGLYPEQSLASARRALALGADMVEMDVRYTRDGEPVICHDDSCLRMFGVDRMCGELTLAQFRALRHAANPEYGAHTLEDVLGSPVRPLLLHCKFTGARLMDLIGRICAADAGQACVLGVPNAEDAEIAAGACPSLRVLAFMPRPEQLAGFLSTPAAYIRLWEDWVCPERVRAVHAAGKQVWVMAGQPEEGSVGVTSRRALLSWREMGVDGILVNDVAWALSVLKS